MCKKKESYIGKSVGDTIAGFINDSRTGVSTCKFLIHPHKRGFENKCLNKLGADPEILKRGGALCWPPWLAGEKNYRFQMV